MKPEINQDNTETQQTEQGCLRVTIFFTVFTAVAIGLMFLLKKFMM